MRQIQSQRQRKKIKRIRKTIKIIKMSKQSKYEIQNAGPQKKVTSVRSKNFTSLRFKVVTPVSISISIAVSLQLRVSASTRLCSLVLFLRVSTYLADAPQPAHLALRRQRCLLRSFL